MDMNYYRDGGKNKMDEPYWKELNILEDLFEPESEETEQRDRDHYRMPNNDYMYDSRSRDNELYGGVNQKQLSDMTVEKEK